VATITDEDIARMRGQLFFDGAEAGRKLSAYWTLLILAAVIAAAGVIADSTATVIGAMIVAPLMTPILGTVLAVVTADRVNLIRSLALVVCGAAAVIMIGWLFGLTTPIDVVAETNGQVSGRVHPRLIDLVAALATGAVGSFALARSDVSDTLPGVAIAISLVPPLVVVGLTLEAGATDQSAGALLLFLTNVGAILLTGLIVMFLFRVSALIMPVQVGGPSWGIRGAVIAVVIFVVALAIPLGASTVQITRERLQTGDVAAVAKTWAEPAGWKIVGVDVDQNGVIVQAQGPLPAPEPDALRRALDEDGLADVDVRLELVPQENVDLPAR